jgi:hypothetical protein
MVDQTRAGQPGEAKLGLRRDGPVLRAFQWNAWRFVWLRFPGNERWVRAHNCRAHLNLRREASPE